MSSKKITADAILELENGKEFTESEALIKLLEISSNQVKEGNFITENELLEKLFDEFN